MKVFDLVFSVFCKKVRALGTRRFDVGKILVTLPPGPVVIPVPTGGVD